MGGVIACALSGCSPDVKLPTNIAPHLQIEPTGAVAKTGESIALTAVLVDAAHTSSSVPAARTIDRPDVFDLTNDGRISARKPGTGIVTATVAQEAASLTCRSVPALDGIWIGQAQLVSATHVGSGPTTLAPAPPGYYELRITQSHDQISATDWERNFLEVLTGSVDVNGLIVLTGVFNDSDGGHSEKSWNGSVDNTGRIAGDFAETLRFTNGFGPQMYQLFWHVIALSR